MSRQIGSSYLTTMKKNHFHASPPILTMGLVTVMLFSLLLGTLKLNENENLKGTVEAATVEYATNNDWPQFHNTVDRAGVNSAETTLDTTNVGGLKLKWRAWTNSTGGYSGSAPAVVNGVVYDGSDDGAVYALNMSDGSLVWKYQTGASVDSSPAVVNGVVYVGSDDKNFYALNASTGTIIWSFTAGDRIAGPALVANNIVYFGSYDGHFYALSAADGSVIWQSPNIWQIWRGGALANGTIFVGTDKSTLYAFDANTGTIKWSTLLGGRVRSNPSVSNGIVYVGCDDGRLYAFDAATGALDWKTAVLPGSPTAVRSSPAIWNGMVYITTSEGDSSTTANGHQYAFDASTGTQLWSFNLPDMSGFSPVVANGLVYSSTYGHNAYAFDATSGAKLWNAGFTTFLGTTGSGTVVNGNFLFLNRDGYLYDYADLTAPLVVFDTKPDASTTSDSANFSWHANENLAEATICTLDSVKVDCGPNSFTVSSLADGSHNFAVTAVDKSNNTGVSTWTWSIDHMAPDISIIKHPSAQMTTNGAVFNITSTTSTATFLCQLDSQPQSVCNPWPQYSDLPDGNHTFKAWAKDSAGNISNNPATYDWLQDTVVPTISVDGPTVILYGQSPSWIETASEPVTFYCSKDEGPYKLCPSPTTMDKPAVGTHTIIFYGVDIVWHKSNYVTITLVVAP